MNSKNIIIVVAVAILIGAGGFFGGMQYQKSKLGSGPAGSFGKNGGSRVQGANQQRMGGQGANGQGLRPVMGSILSQDDKSITVKLADGSSKIILFATATSINKAAEISKGDLKVGDTVRIFGSVNTDGSVTAQNIQLNPEVPSAPAQSTTSK